MSHGPLHSAAGRVYRGNGWPSDELENGVGFALTIDGTDSTWSALALTEADAFTFYSLAPVDARPDRLGQVGEYLHRANHGLVTETFELDYDTGEIRLRTGIELLTMAPGLLEDPDALDALVLDLSAANVGVFDRYLSGLVAVAVGGANAADVIAEIEAPADLI
ncbi:MAG: hypothetical protein JWN61_254 [Pseudonocardiales bacterium]|nr:hypothetical protein [Pseudonocardiales bacterium]